MGFPSLIRITQYERFAQSTFCNSTMPLFGSRMVCETANVQRMHKRRKEMEEREERLAQWAKEKAARKERIRSMQEIARKGSVVSNASSSSGTAAAAGGRSTSRPASPPPPPPPLRKSETSASIASSVFADDTQFMVGDGRNRGYLCPVQCSVM